MLSINPAWNDFIRIEGQIESSASKRKLKGAERLGVNRDSCDCLGDCASRGCFWPDDLVVFYLRSLS